VKITLLHNQHVNTISSASVIERIHNKLLVAGDDSNYIFILNTEFQLLYQIAIANFTTNENNRIDKNIKHDIEAGFLFENNRQIYLCLLGSGSRSNRTHAYILLIDEHINYYFTLDFSKLYDAILLQLPKYNELNIEGAAIVNNDLILVQRGNLKQNNFIIIFHNFNVEILLNKDIEPLSRLHFNVIEITPLYINGAIAGITGVSFIKEKNWLLFTAAAEYTMDVYRDGVIAGAQLFYIDMNITDLATWQLQPIDYLFEYKIESICYQIINEEIILFLVADNDNGSSHFYKMKLIHE